MKLTEEKKYEVKIYDDSGNQIGTKTTTIFDPQQPLIVGSQIFTALEPVFKRVLYRNNQGDLHRLNGPAIIYYTKNDNIIAYYWKMNGRLHREEDKPASFERNFDAQVEIWYKSDMRHRDGNNPALIIKRGEKIVKQSYYVRDDLHRTNGPATKDEKQEYYYLNGSIGRNYFKCKGGVLINFRGLIGIPDADPNIIIKHYAIPDVKDIPLYMLNELRDISPRYKTLVFMRTENEEISS